MFFCCILKILSEMEPAPGTNQVGGCWFNRNGSFSPVSVSQRRDLSVFACLDFFSSEFFFCDDGLDFNNSFLNNTVIPNMKMPTREHRRWPQRKDSLGLRPLLLFGRGRWRRVEVKRKRRKRSVWVGSLVPEWNNNFQPLGEKNQL